MRSHHWPRRACRACRGRRRKSVRIAGPGRCPGTEPGQARTRNRRRRRPLAADDRAAGLRQVDARGPAARPVADAAARGGPCLCGRALAGRPFPARKLRLPALPRATPHGVGRRPGRRWQSAAPRRDLAGPPRSALPRRTARVRPQGAGDAARAARDRARAHRPRRAPRRVPGRIPAGRRDEPLPLRFLRPRQRQVPMHPGPDRPLPGTPVRPLPRPHRPAHRSTGAAR